MYTGFCWFEMRSIRAGVPSRFSSLMLNRIERRLVGSQRKSPRSTVLSKLPSANGAVWLSMNPSFWSFATVHFDFR